MNPETFLKMSELPWVTVSEGIIEYELSDFFRKHPITTELLSDTQALIKLRSLINGILDASRTLIFAYTGMRHHESEVIEKNCLQWIDIPSIGEIPLVMSRTSKMTNNNYSETLLAWASSHEVIPAIEAALAIQDIFEISSKYLFASPEKHDTIRMFIDSQTQKEIFLNIISQTNPECIKVTAEDVKELENFDAFRDWRNDVRLNLNIGKYWPLSKHQFRRSTAVYSARSGKVSLPSLKFQFKHLHDSMTMLYRENSSFAENILRNSTSTEAHAIIYEFMDEVRLLEALDFEARVVKSNTPLFGGAGARLHQEKIKNYPDWFDDIGLIHRRIKDGRLSYRETIIGGCTSREMCDKFNVDEVIPCLSGCEDAVLGGDDGLGNKAGFDLKRYKETLVSELKYIDEKHPAAEMARNEIKLIDIKLLEGEDANE